MVYVHYCKYVKSTILIAFCNFYSCIKMSALLSHMHIYCVVSEVLLLQDKDAFAAILRRISKIQKTNGANFVVLRER